jgi:hypothetical protein
MSSDTLDTAVHLGSAPSQDTTQEALMIYPIELIEAAQTLVAECGTHIAASRRGGRLRFVTILCQRFGLAEAEATRIIAALERCQALGWVSAHGPLQPCPGMLELWGAWRLQLERLQEPVTA